MTKKIVLGIYLILILSLSVFSVVADDPVAEDSYPDSAGGGGGGSSAVIPYTKIIGESDAPVHMIAYLDFEDPFSQRFFQDSLISIGEDYMENGNLKYEVRNFPLEFHVNAFNAAKATECAAAQGKFQEFHSELIEGDMPTLDYLRLTAAKEGLNTAEYEACMSSSATTDRVNYDIERGKSDGVSGTPTVFINGEKIVGAQPYEVFQAAIDKHIQTEEPPLTLISLYVGSSTKYDGKTVKLERISGDSAVFSVNGVAKVIDQGETENVNGVYITANNIQDTYVFTALRTHEVMLPNYIVSSIRVSPTPSEGKISTIYVTVKNNGQGNSGSMSWLDLTVNGNRIAHVHRVPGLQAGATYTYAHGYNFNAGTYKIMAEADAENLIRESYESDNKLTHTVNIASDLKPDLMIQQVRTSPVSPKAGDYGNIQATLKNIGGISSGQFEADMYIDNVFHKRMTVSALSPGGNYYMTVPYTFTQGTHKVRIVVDPNYQISESNEGNNKFYHNIYISQPTVQKPDFVVDSIKVSPGILEQGDTAYITYTFRNTGSAGAQLSYTATMQTPKITTGASTVQSPSATRYLGAGQTYTTTVTTKLNDAGQYTATAIADPSGKVDELSETNNKQIRGFYVKPTSINSDINVYLDQKFDLSKTQTATVQDYKNLEIKMTNVDSADNWATFQLGNIPTSTGTITLHRDHLYCGDDTPVTSSPNGGLNQVLQVGPGTDYFNYKCYNRKTEQCDTIGDSIEVRKMVFDMDILESVGGSSVSHKVVDNAKDHAISVNNVEFVEGRNGKAVKFNGDGYIKIPHSEDLNLDEFTIEAWVKLDSEPSTWSGSYQTIISKENEYILRFANGHDEKGSGRILSSVHFASGQNHANAYLPGFSYTSEGYAGHETSDVEFDTNQWYKMEMEYDGSYLTVRIDDEVVSKTKYAKESSSSTNDLYIGSHIGGRDKFVGMIEDVKIWNNVQEYDNSDSYYKEWCAYPTPAVTAKYVTIRAGQNYQVDDVIVNLVDISGGVATMIVSKTEYQESLSIGIEPRFVSVTDGENAHYTLVVKDGHNSGSYVYAVTALGLPFDNDLPESIVVSAGQTKRIPFQVRTDAMEDIPELSPIRPVSGATVTFEQVTEAQEYCISNSEDTEEYNDCAISVSVKRPIIAPVKIQNYKSYRFALRVYSTSESDVAYGTLSIRPVTVIPPEFPTDEVTITLDKGWNLMSLGGSKLATFKGSTCEEQKLISFAYLQDHAKYYSIVKAQTILGNGFNNFISKNAFWVYSFDDCKITAEVDKYIKYNDLSLQPGWNLVPITDGMIGQSLESIGNNCNMQKIYSWESGSQSWNSVSEDDIFQESHELGGLAVKTSNYCQLGNTVVDNPPQFPN